MTTPTEPTRNPDGSPAADEVAALTARLRDPSPRRRRVDPAERAAFLADKDVLITRITDADVHTDADADSARGAPPGVQMPGWMRDQAARAEAQWPDGVIPTPRVDETAAIAQRLATMRAEHTALPGRSRGPQPVRPSEEEERREQLARWHADDHSDDADWTGCCVDSRISRGEDR